MTLPKPAAIIALALAAGVTMGVDAPVPTPPHDRLEQRPADAYLGDKWLSANGDFDADGYLDEAFFAKDRDAGTIALVVSFGWPTKRDRIVLTLEETEHAIRNSGLKVARAGHYTGACAKGYGGPCEEGEDALVLPHDGIFYFWYESSSRLYYLPEDALDGNFKVFYLSD